MKKSRQIQLVLISAAFASCSPVVIPHYTITANNIDSTLTQYNGILPPINCDCNQEYVSNVIRQAAGSSHYVITAMQQSNAFVTPYRTNNYWSKKKFIQYGGFGSSMSNVAS